MISKFISIVFSVCEKMIHEQFILQTKIILMLSCIITWLYKKKHKDKLKFLCYPKKKKKIPLLITFLTISQDDSNQPNQRLACIIPLHSSTWSIIRYFSNPIIISKCTSMLIGPSKYFLELKNLTSRNEWYNI